MFRLRSCRILLTVFIPLQYEKRELICSSPSGTTSAVNPA